MGQASGALFFAKANPEGGASREALMSWQGYGLAAAGALAPPSGQQMFQAHGSNLSALQRFTKVPLTIARARKPPSTASIWPVIKAERTGSRRKIVAPAISSGRA